MLYIMKNKFLKLVLKISISIVSVHSITDISGLFIFALPVFCFLECRLNVR